jgi:hypothetical protein
MMAQRQGCSEERQDRKPRAFCEVAMRAVTTPGYRGTTGTTAREETDMSVEEGNMGNPDLQLKVEWQKAREAADHLTGMLADEVSYLTDGDKLKNVYSHIAWIRLCRAISTLTDGGRMRTQILMVFDKAERLADEELAEENAPLL